MSWHCDWKLEWEDIVKRRKRKLSAESIGPAAPADSSMQNLLSPDPFMFALPLPDGLSRSPNVV